MKTKSHEENKEKYFDFLTQKLVHCVAGKKASFCRLMKIEYHSIGYEITYSISDVSRNIRSAAECSAIFDSLTIQWAIFALSKYLLSLVYDNSPITSANIATLF